MNKDMRDVRSMSLKEHRTLLLKRCIALPSKMIGFKPLCLYLATYLLITGKISEWVWFAVLISVLFGIVGLKVLAQIRNRESENIQLDMTSNNEIGG